MGSTLSSSLGLHSPVHAPPTKEGSNLTVGLDDGLFFFLQYCNQQYFLALLSQIYCFVFPQLVVSHLTICSAQALHSNEV